MADDKVALTIEGLEDLRRTLDALPEKLRRRVLLNALRAAGRVVRNASRAAAPVLAVPTDRRASGTLRRAITVRTSKAARREGNAGVFVNVRPAKGSNRGAKSPTDPFFWRFVQFGTKHMDARPFLDAGIAALPDALRAFEEAIGPQLAKLNAPTKGSL